MCVFFHSISKLLPIQQHHHHHQHHQHHHHHNNWTLSIVFKCLPRPFPNQIDDPSLFLCLKINADERSSRAGEAGFATYLSSSRAREPAEPASLLPPARQVGQTAPEAGTDKAPQETELAFPPPPPLGAAFTCYPSPFFRMYRKSACYPSLLTCYPSPFACYPSPFACYPSGCPLLPFGLLSRVPSNLRSPLIGSIGLRK